MEMVKQHIFSLFSLHRFSQTLDLLEEKERSKVAYSNYKKLVQIL